jgi:hypothetical protein
MCVCVVCWGVGHEGEQVWVCVWVGVEWLGSSMRSPPPPFPPVALSPEQLGSSVEKMSVMDAANGYHMHGGFLQQPPGPSGQPGPPLTQYVPSHAALPAAGGGGHYGGGGGGGGTGTAGAPGYPHMAAPLANRHMGAGIYQPSSLLRSNSAV